MTASRDESSSREAAGADASGGAEPRASWAPKTPPALPGVPPDQPVARDPVEGVSLEAYARISAEVAEGRRDAGDILREKQLTQVQWLAVEQEWAIRIAAAALRGDLSFAQDYDQAYVEAQSALGPEQPTHTLADFASIAAELELAQDTAPVVLARRGLTIADFARLSRFWNALLGQDSQLSRSFHAQVAEDKKRMGGKG